MDCSVIWALVIAHRSPMSRLCLSRLRRKSPCRGFVVSRQWVWRRVDLYLRLTFLNERHGCARTGRLTVLFVSKVFRSFQRLLLRKEALKAGDSAWRHSCIACGGDVCFINRVASTPETKTTASESSSSSSSSLSHPSRLRLSLPRQAHPKSKRRIVLRLSSALSRWLSNFEPFFLLSYRCLSFPRPPSVTRASRFTLANKRPSLARPRPEQDFCSLSRAILHRTSYKPTTA